MTTVASQITAHSLAEELRSVGHIEIDPSEIPEKRKSIADYPNEADYPTVYANISDDFTCIAYFFKLNDKTITSKGIRVSDKYPKMMMFCSELLTRAEAARDAAIAQFNTQYQTFKDELARLKTRDENIDAITSADEWSETKVFINAETFDQIVGLIGTSGFITSNKRETFKKIIGVMLDLMRNTPIDTSTFSEQKKKFYEHFSAISENNRVHLTREFEAVLRYFAKCVLYSRCPVAISGKLHCARRFIKDLELKAIFAYLGISADSTLAVLSV
jgi:hypothetical protein